MVGCRGHCNSPIVFQASAACRLARNDRIGIGRECQALDGGKELVASESNHPVDINYPSPMPDAAPRSRPAVRESARIELRF